MNSKATGLVNLVNSMNSAGQVIDAIGTQMHLSVSVFLRVGGRGCMLTNAVEKAGGAGGASAVVKYLAGAKGVKEIAITGTYRLLSQPSLCSDS